MRVRSYLDSRTGQPHIHGHNVTAAEVEEILNDPGEDRLATTRRASPLVAPRQVGTSASSTCQTPGQEASS